MNKVFLFLGLAILGSLHSHAQSNSIDFTIDGKIPGIKSGKIYFSVFGITGKKDSAEIKKGAFRFRGSLPEPSPVVLSLDRNHINKPLFMFFVDKGTHSVKLNKDELENSQVTGPAATMDYERLRIIEKPLDDYLNALFERLKGENSADARRMEDSIVTVYYYVKKDLVEKFITAHPSTAAAAWATHMHFWGNPELAPRLEALYKILPPAYLSTSYGKEMKEAIERNNELSIGNVAPNFTQKDTADKAVSLTDFRGKYVLLDFWASWCMPCRKDNPNVVKAFNAFKDKGFTVLSVSLDRPGQKAAWLRAIQMDGLTWTHVSDLKWWDNEVAKVYGVKAVPTNLLIGPDGKIVAKNLHGGELEKKLAEIIK